MSTRVGPPAVLPSTTNIDARRDLTRELMQAGDLQLTAAAAILEQVALTGSDKQPGRAPTTQEVHKGLLKLQREAGLPTTGRFDAPTMLLLQRLGYVHRADGSTTSGAQVPAPPSQPGQRQTPTAQQAASAPASSSSTPSSTSSSTSSMATAASLAAQTRDTMDKGLQAGGFALVGRTVGAGRGASTTTTPPPPSLPSSSLPVDRAFDPARLLASLVAAGVTGQGAAEAVSAFQALVGLPVTGHVDDATHQALRDTAVIAATAPGEPLSSPTSTVTANSTTSTTPSAATTTTSAADTIKAATLAQAASARAAYSTTTGTGASSTASMKRAPLSAAEAREQARLQSLLAQAAAVERGVQANRADLVAVVGDGQRAGTASGLTGSGGHAGGLDGSGTEAALVVDERERGEESSTGNQHSGDDDHDDTDRGDAVDARGDDAPDASNTDDDTGHHRVPSLSAQVSAALKEITRLDDNTVPVHYAWDVTLFRPGVYRDGQTAEPLWHLVVEQAHAFDPVWARAVEAIATRLLLVEPEATPLTLPDVVAALRQARVR